MTDSKGGIEMKVLIMGNGRRSGTKPRWIGSMPPFFLKVVATW